MRNLILQIHLDTLKRNLEGIQGGLKTFKFFQEQQQNIETLQSSIEVIYLLPSEILRNCGVIKNFLQDFCQTITFPDKLIEPYNTSRTQANTVESKVRELNTSLIEIKDQIKSLEEQSKKTEIWLKKLLETEVSGKIETLLERIYTAQGKLERQQENNGESINSLWDEVRQIDEDSQKIFTEYIEFLSGLAMRGAGLDSEICNFADNLISQITEYPILKGPIKYSLTIPARHEARENSPAGLIRVGFPEWTIWTLPLVISEYGYILVRKIPALRQYIDGAEPKNRHLVVDAFATFILGPAYACAVILLRLDIQGPEQMPSALERYSVILTMLNRMNEHALGKGLDPYSEIIKQLENAWQEYIQQTGSSISCLSDDQTIKEIKEKVERVWNTFKDVTFVLYPHGEWINIRDDWQNKIKDPNLNIGQDLRHILNGAWNERLKNHQDIDIIAETAISLWKGLTSKTQRESQKSAKQHSSMSSIKKNK